MGILQAHRGNWLVPEHRVLKSLVMTDNVKERTLVTMIFKVTIETLKPLRRHIPVVPRDLPLASAASVGCPTIPVYLGRREFLGCGDFDGTTRTVQGKLGQFCHSIVNPPSPEHPQCA